MILKIKNVEPKSIASKLITRHTRPHCTNNKREVDRWRIFFSNPCRGRGYITSTPKSAEFLKKTRKWRKYERDSCIPEPKNGERPYLAVPEATFWGPIFSSFFVNFLHFNHQSYSHFIFCSSFYLYYIPSTSTPGMLALSYNSITNSIHRPHKQSTKYTMQIL